MHATGALWESPSQKGRREFTPASQKAQMTNQVKGSTSSYCHKRSVLSSDRITKYGETHAYRPRGQHFDSPATNSVDTPNQLSVLIICSKNVAASRGVLNRSFSIEDQCAKAWHPGKHFSSSGDRPQQSAASQTTFATPVAIVTNPASRFTSAVSVPYLFLWHRCQQDCRL